MGQTNSTDKLPVMNLKSRVDSILPAAGTASRMRGLPKFLLPIDDRFTTLIELHANRLAKTSERVWIPINPDFANLLIKLDNLPKNAVVIPMNTQSMTETLLNVMGISESNYFKMIMPDTFFFGEQPYDSLVSESLATVACWKIRPDQRGKLGQVQVSENQTIVDIRDKDINCEYDLSWGAVGFDRKLEEYMAITDSTLGIALSKSIKSGERLQSKTVEGEYFDCGTPGEYLTLLSKLSL
jgi:hypothetical protein